MFNMVYSIALVFGSSWMVVNWAPQAAGAGVAEVMAYLNGCMLPHVRTCTLTFPVWTRTHNILYISLWLDKQLDHNLCHLSQNPRDTLYSHEAFAVFVVCSTLHLLSFQAQQLVTGRCAFCCKSPGIETHAQ